MLYTVWFTLLCCLSGSFAGLLGPCKKGDMECLTASVNKVHSTVYSGIPSLGVESSDPMFQDVIEGDLSILKYTFTNTTVKGFKDCTIKNIDLNLEALKLHYDMDCPSIAMTGDYEISGRLIILPVEGKGTFEIITSKYLIQVDSDLKIIMNDGKTYMNTKNFKLKPEALGPIKFYFKNLFNGQKDLSDAVHKFAHENWKEVVDFVQEPVFKKNLKKINTNYNKFLKTEPLEEIFVN